MLSRRTFLVGAAAATAWGCTSSGRKSSSSGGSASSGPTTTTTVPRKPGERPDPSKPEGTDMLPQIDHVVVVMMENHSFDNYLGVLGRGDGFTFDGSGHPTNANTGTDGNAVRSFHMANTCQLPGQPSQAWNPTHVQWNDGAMDGFVRSDSGPVAMGYWTGDDLPFYYGLASTFPVCDRWFGSCMAQTFPNRRFLLAGTARGNLRTDLNTVTDFQPPNGTIMESLGRNGIDWRDYYTTLPTTGLFAPVIQANADKLVKIDQFYADAAAGSLPAFCLVEPDYDHASEENSEDISMGEAFVASVVEAVMAS
ncbi:MAG: alkaline phosphatase family protein, partial [Acidimicrobiales bacterium]